MKKNPKFKNQNSKKIQNPKSKLGSIGIWLLLGSIGMYW